MNPPCYWYQYFILENLNCDEYVIPNWWFLNSWHDDNITIKTPVNAKWARISIHNLSLDPKNEIRMLDIKIITT